MTGHRSPMGRTASRLPAVAAATLAALTFVALSLPMSNANLSAATDSEARFTAQTAQEILTGAVWHLDATDLTSLFTGADCKGPVSDPDTVGTAQEVKCWKDQNNPTQSVTNTWLSGPLLTREAALNNNTALHFQGSWMGSTTDVFGGSTTDATVFLISREHERTPNWVFNLNGNSNSNRFSVHLPWTDGKIYFDSGNLNDGRSTSTPLPVGTVLLLTAWKDSSIGRSGHHINHQALSLSPRNPTAVTTGGLQLGRDALHDLGEFVVFDRRLNEWEEEVVEHYLKEKWGVPES